MKNRFRSIQWKIVLIYGLLILVAMEIIWVYLFKSLENYHMTNFDNYLEAQGRGISFTLKDNIDSKSLKNIINMYMGPNSNVKYIYVLNKKGDILASSTGETGRMMTPAIVKALSGEISSETTNDYNTNAKLRDFAIPIYDNYGDISGVVYISGSLKGIYETLSDVNLILLSATLFAVSVTIILGYILSKTITDPIKEVTKYAREMADGNFDVQINIKSKDEIGKLGEMFNLLSSRLKETLNDIQAEKNKVEAIIQFMKDGVIATDSGGGLIHYNEAAKDILGKDLNYKMNIKTVLDFDDAILESEREISFFTNNNKVLSIHISPLKNREILEGYVYVIHDITEQHKLDNMRKEFVANVSHELRTPLATIKSYTETLLYDDVEKEYEKKFLNIINIEVDRMTRLVRDLLLLSRMDSEEDNLNRTFCRLNDIVANVVHRMNIEAEKKNQKMFLSLGDEKKEIYIDKDKIEQLIVNIISNSIKYTQDNGDIKVITKYTDNFAVFVVEDNGIGIPKEDLPRIFERFYRVDKARSREFGGTGLGLSIVKQIAKVHGGDVEIKSDIGKGTIVEVKIPY